jgi:hypothetical protein
VQCARLMAQKQYWRGETLYTSVLCIDTEIALRQGNLRLLLYQKDTALESGPVSSTKRKKADSPRVARENVA